MKKLMAVCFAALALCAAAAEEPGATSPDLVWWCKVSSMSRLSPKISALGEKIGNPIIPTMMLAGIQQQFSSTYGAFRSDARFVVLWYKSAKDKTPISVLAYPAVDGPAKMLLNHPGSTKDAEGTIHLLPALGRESDNYVRFTEDGKYCVFADSAERAKLAIKDFQSVDGCGGFTCSAPNLFRFKFLEPGLKLLADMEAAQSNVLGLDDLGISDDDSPEVVAASKEFIQAFGEFSAAETKRNLRAIALYKSAELMVDVENDGLVAKLDITPKAAPAAPVEIALPPKAANHAPKGAALFAFGNSTADPTGCANAAEFEASKLSIRKMVKSGMRLLAAKNAKYAKACTQTGELIDALIASTAMPRKKDWAGAWIGCDNAKRPYWGMVAKFAAAETFCTAQETFLAKFTEMLESNFPKSGVLTRTGELDYKLSLGSVIDLSVRESGEDLDKDERETIAKAKENLKKAFGGDALRIAMKRKGAKVTAQVAPEAIAAEAAKRGDGELKLKNALPEIEAQRPSGVFWFSAYGFLRDFALPIAEKFAGDTDEAAQFKVLAAALPPPAENSAIAAATWNDKDGSIRGILRITNGELKNFGASFNAFTAAAMGMGGADDDDDAADDED